jgi:hypothetical protein
VVREIQERRDDRPGYVRGICWSNSSEEITRSYSGSYYSGLARNYTIITSTDFRRCDRQLTFPGVIFGSAKDSSYWKALLKAEENVLMETIPYC